MKNLIVLIVVLMTFMACHKQNNVAQDYALKGIITEMDLSMCPSPCCGGWFFTAADGRKMKIHRFPDSLDFNPNSDTMPIHVEFDIESESEALVCNLKVIRFARIRKAR